MTTFVPVSACVRRLSVVAVAGALALSGTAVASAQPAAPAGLTDVTTLSSNISDEVEISVAKASAGLPAPVKEVASQLGIALPGTNAYRAVRADLQTATTAHLVEQGHSPNATAQTIAPHWANDAAAGKVSFQDGVGHGATGADQGTGNILRLTASEAKDRQAWLDRKANRHNNPTGFGVATASDGTYIYIAEFFLK